MPINPMDAQSERDLLLGVLYVLKEGSDKDRQEVINEQVPRLHDRETARKEFIQLLSYGLPEKEADGGDWRLVAHRAEVRAWAATALAELYGKEDKVSRSAISDRLTKETESVPRFWMLFALYRLGSHKSIEPVVRGILKRFAKDHPIQDGFDNTRAGPLALTLLASWGDREATKTLEDMLGSQAFNQMWSACRALETVSCRVMLEPLQRVAEDRAVWPDIRNKSVKALSKIESPSAIHALDKVATEDRDAIIRESAIEGLEHLGQSAIVRNRLHQLSKPQDCLTKSLMDALTDENAQIRHRAAEALPRVMLDPKDQSDGSQRAKDRALAQARERAAEKVVGKLVCERDDSGVSLLVDALRVIDPQAAAAVLSKSDYLYSDDASVRKRVEHALKQVGGDKAVQTLMGLKSEVLGTYNALLTKADEPIQALFKETMRQAQHSFAISQWMSITVFAVGVLTLLAGLYVAFTAGEAGIQFVFGAGTSLVAIMAVVLDMMFRDPHKRVREATSILLRVKVIFLGYVRQIHQVDASFKHEFIERGKDFGIEQTQESVKQISEVMQHTMDMVVQHLPVSKSEKLAVDEVLKPWQERLEAAVRATEQKDESSSKKVETGKATAGDSPDASADTGVAGKQ